jgi:hypothetical protein
LINSRIRTCTSATGCAAHTDALSSKAFTLRAFRFSFAGRGSTTFAERVLCRGGRPRGFESFMRAGRTARFCFGRFLELLSVLLFRFESKGYDFEESVKLFPSLFMASYPVIDD